MFSWLMSKYYDAMLRDAEEKCLKNWRNTLLHDLSGDVLELGCGTGANLGFYPDTIKNLTLTEPSRHMRRQLTSKLDNYHHLHVSVQACTAESLPFPDKSFDAVVSTLLLCTVKQPEQSLSEMSSSLFDLLVVNTFHSGVTKHY